MDNRGYQKWPGQGNGAYNRCRYNGGFRGGNRGGFQGGNRGGSAYNSNLPQVAPSFQYQGANPSSVVPGTLPVASPFLQDELPSRSQTRLPVAPSTGPAFMHHPVQSGPSVNIPTQSAAAAAAVTDANFDKWVKHINHGLARNRSNENSRLPVIDRVEVKHNNAIEPSDGTVNLKAVHDAIDREKLARRMKHEQEGLENHKGLRHPLASQDSLASENFNFAVTDMPASSPTEEPPKLTPQTSTVEGSFSKTAEELQGAETQIPSPDASGFITGEAKLSGRFIPTLTPIEPTENDINPKTGKVFTMEEWESKVRARDIRRLERAAKRNKDAKQKNAEVKSLLHDKDDLPAEQKIAILVKALEEKTASLEQVRASHIAIKAETDKFKREMQRANASAINYRNDFDQANQELIKERKKHVDAVLIIEDKLSQKEEELKSTLTQLRLSEKCCQKQEESTAKVAEDLRLAREQYAELEESSSKTAAANEDLTHVNRDLALEIGDLKKQLNERDEQLNSAEARISELESTLSGQSELLKTFGETLEELRQEIRGKADAVEADAPSCNKSALGTDDRDNPDAVQDGLLTKENFSISEQTVTATGVDQITDVVSSTETIDNKIEETEEPFASTHLTIANAAADRYPEFDWKKAFLFLIKIFLVTFSLNAAWRIFYISRPTFDIALQLQPINHHISLNATTCSPIDLPSTSAVSQTPTTTIATHTSNIPDDYFASFQQVVKSLENSSFVEDEEGNEWMKEGVCEYEEFPRVRKAIFTAVLAVGISGIVWFSPIGGV